MSSPAPTAPGAHEFDPVVERLLTVDSLRDLFKKPEVGISERSDIGLIAYIGGIAAYPGDSTQSDIRINAVNFMYGDRPRSHVLFYGGQFAIYRYLMDPRQDEIHLLGQQQATHDRWLRTIIDTAIITPEETDAARNRVIKQPGTFQFKAPPT